MGGLFHIVTGISMVYNLYKLMTEESQGITSLQFLEGLKCQLMIC